MKQLLKIVSITYLIIVVQFAGCDKGMDNLQVIDVESNAKRFEQAALSSYCSDLTYISLETHPGLSIGNTVDLIFHDSLLLIGVLVEGALYDLNGDFIASVGSIGRGPGEYTSFANPAINSRGEIIIQDLYDMHIYNTDGSHWKTFKKFFLIDTASIIGSWLPIDDSLFFGKITSITGMESDKAVIISNKGAVVARFRNYMPLRLPKRIMGQEDRTSHIRYFENNLYFKEVFNDTVFVLSSEYDLLPVFVFRLGKYSMPDSERGAIPPVDNQYFRIRDFFQTERYIFIVCYMGDNFPARRLTPRVVYNDIISWYNSKDALGIYDKLTGDFFFCDPTSTDNPLCTTGILNDVDAGPRFMPYAQVNDSTLLMLVDPKDLKEHVSGHEFRNSQPLFPEKKIALEKLANSLSDEDNPVLMVVTIK